MNARLLLLLATLIGFGAGVAADRWMLCHICTPRPPKSAMADVHGDKKPVPCTEEEVAKIQKEIDDYRDKTKFMRDAFREKLNAIFTAEQRAQFDKHPRLGPDTKAPRPKYGEPGWVPLALIYPSITADNLKDEVKLTPEQHAQIVALLKDERKVFLEYSDANPPPSFKLHQLAPGKP